MSNYPNGYDDDATLPVVNDNLTEIGGIAINSLRDAVFQMQQALGLNIAGVTPSLAARLGVFINPDGTPNASVMTSLGLVTLPVRNDQIAENAGIPESKLRLDFRTQDLFNYTRDLALDVNATLGWINTQGIKLEPHLMGAIYRHTMDQIDVSASTANFLSSVFRTLRDNTQSYTLVKDMNAELLAHQWADGSPFGVERIIVTNNGSVYTTDFAHVGSGIFINPSRFNNIPQTLDNLQLFAEFIDSQSIFLLGTRIQNLFSSGISRVSQSSNLQVDGYGQFLVPPTPATAFLLNIGNSSGPFDDINTGDDIVVFNPPQALQDNNYFDSLFALVRPGDIIRVHYGDGYNIEVPYVIKEKKYNPSPGNKKYLVRIAGKNQAYSPNAIARIDKPLSNVNKYGELSISPVNNQFNATPSLIINNPRGAQATGVGFAPDQFDEDHYMLYLAFYPTGVATDGYVFLPGIDVTGNAGTTPGAYTLESIVQATNNAFHKVGFNYRFTAFAFGGEFGICLADSYNNAAFSIVSTAIAPNGSIDTLSNNINFPKNVIAVVPTVGTVAADPLGFGSTGSGVASPPFMTSYGSSAAALNPTKLFVALRRNNYYVNGTETERLAKEDSQALDGYGDGYWVATVQDIQIQPGRVSTTYRIPLNLDTSGLKIGKTIVVQSLGAGSLVDYGRFIIQSVNINCAPNVYTDITVYDSVHAKGFSPTPTLQPFAQVKIYFSSDSVSFNTESATDYTVVTPFKRHFEVYVDDEQKTFTHERGRITMNGGNITVNGTTLYGYSQLNKLDIVTISPKLRGYQFGAINKISLYMSNYSSATGMFDGYLCSYDGVDTTHEGPRTLGKKGDVIRFYDETYVDYIDVIMNINETITNFSNQVIDFQLFPTLQLDVDLMLLGTCQVNDTTQTVSKIVDRRQFGNISEKDLSSSVFDYMSMPEKHLHSNGIVRGFEIFDVFDGDAGIISLTGGLVLVDGKFIDMNNDSVSIPILYETYNFSGYPINWALCVNKDGDYDIIPLLDYDSNTGTPNDPTRIFTVFDPVSSATYTLPATTFSDLINKRTDLTILYIVESYTSGSGDTSTIALDANDARKFVYKKDWGEIVNISIDSNNGDFRNFNALDTWLRFNSTFNNTVHLKGIFSDMPNILAYNLPVKFVGDGQTVINESNFLTANSITFEGITFNINSLTLNDAPISRCVINFNTNGSTLQTFNVHMFDTTINYTTTFSGGSLFFNNGTKLQNVTININSGTNQNVVFTSAIVEDCTINVNNSNVQITVDSNSVIQNCTINTNNGTTFSVAGTLSNCTVNMLTSGSQNPIQLTGSSNTAFNIVDNRFVIGAFSTPPTSILQVLSGINGNISDNMFFRNGVTLTNGYIEGPGGGSGAVAVVGNFFDSTTIDGTDNNLIKNSVLTWKIANNTNTPVTTTLRRITGGSTYTVVAIDHILTFDLTSSAMQVFLPSIAITPPGRIIVIKDATGNADIRPITLVRGAIADTIEGLVTNYIYNIPFGSITLMADVGGWIIV